MRQMSVVKKSVYCAVCIALCVVVPMAFHTIQSAGSIFLPMHIPVLLCGLICGWPFGLVCGLVGPLLSSVLTGMPPIAILPAMMVELAVYGLTAGVLLPRIRTGKPILDLYITLIVAMLAGRILGGVARALLLTPGTYTMAAWVTGSFITSLPGIVIQLLLIPLLYTALEKSKLIPGR